MLYVNVSFLRLVRWSLVELWLFMAMFSRFLSFTQTYHTIFLHISPSNAAFTRVPNYNLPFYWNHFLLYSCYPHTLIVKLTSLSSINNIIHKAFKSCDMPDSNIITNPCQPIEWRTAVLWIIFHINTKIFFVDVNGIQRNSYITFVVWKTIMPWTYLNLPQPLNHVGRKKTLWLTKL